MKPSIRTPTRKTIDALEEAKFDVTREIKKHIDDVEARIEAEQNKNKTSKVILEGLLKEREQTLSAVIPYQFIKPQQVVDIEEGDSKAMTAIKLNL
jgi:hypothetical protein